MNVELVDWQRIDPNNGLVEPWWTYPCMDVIKTWALKESTWLEFGSGLSTAWLRNKCQWVDSIEADMNWAAKVDEYCKQNSLYNGTINWQQIPDGDEKLRQAYFDLIPDTQYDIISVDGIFRDECLEWALDHFKNKSGIIIADNWQQDYVYISPKAEELMKPYQMMSYIQPDHTNHEGRPWQTVIWEIWQ